MSLYEQPIATYQIVDTPLSEQYDLYEEPPLRISKAEIYRDPIQQRMMLILVAVIVTMLAVGFTIVPRLNFKALADSTTAVANSTTIQEEQFVDAPAAMPVSGAISPVFSAEVQYWAPQIVAWAEARGLDPDIAATIMQIESCGNPDALSGAGAQGLFQVMPFHFVPGEDAFDPDTNARRGLDYYVDRLQQTRGDVFQAFAGYNGGHVAAAGSWTSWAAETQRYYTWSKGIYEDAKAGLEESPTLQQWLNAGGASLCRQAAAKLGL